MEPNFAGKPSQKSGKSSIVNQIAPSNYTRPPVIKYKDSNNEHETEWVLSRFVRVMKDPKIMTFYASIQIFLRLP